MQDGEPEASIAALVQALRQIQEERYMSLRGLARKLGFSAGYLSLVFSGRRRPGNHLIRAVLQHFPELGPLVLSIRHSPRPRRGLRRSYKPVRR